MKYRLLLGILPLLLLAACSLHESDGPVPEANGDVIRIGGEISQVYVTRASDQGFADGDEIGIYVVDYDGAVPGELTVSGTRASNLRFTFNEASWAWIPDHEIYYKDKTFVPLLPGSSWRRPSRNSGTPSLRP